MPSLRAAFARIGSIMRDALHSAGCALRTTRRSIGEHRYPSPAHRWRLIQQRNDACPMCLHRQPRSYGPLLQMTNMSMAVMRPSLVNPTFIRPWMPGRARGR